MYATWTASPSKLNRSDPLQALGSTVLYSSQSCQRDTYSYNSVDIEYDHLTDIFSNYYIASKVYLSARSVYTFGIVHVACIFSNEFTEISRTNIMN